MPSVLPFYENSSLVIVPIRIAGGTRIKILEAFACRRPVISTTIGAEGLDLESNKHCIKEDDPEGFAQACVSLLNDFDTANILTEQGYQFVKEKYDTSIVVKSIRELFSQS